MDMSRPLAVLLSLALVAGAPGVPAVRAAAAVARGVAPSKAVVAGWAGVQGRLLTLSAAAPRPVLTPQLEDVLGQSRFSLAQNPGAVEAQAALAFLEHLPPSVAGDPGAFSAREPADQAAALAAAAAAASARLQARAEDFLARGAEFASSPEQRRELMELAAAWFYLSPETGAAVRALAAAEREKRSLGLSRRVAQLLARPAADEASAKSEVDFVLSGAAALTASNRGPKDGASAALAPYVARALDRAALFQARRGFSAVDVYGRVLGQTDGVFGGRAAKPLLQALRPAGQWTEFVAAASLHAARRLEGAAELRALQDAAASPDMRMAIPAWHPAAASGAATVAEFLAARHGATLPSFPVQGRLFTAFGIPVRADGGFFLALGVMTYQFAVTLFAAAPYPLLSAFAALVLLYGSLLLHEFGHALTARAFGVKTYGISLNFMGGAAHLEREPRRPLVEFLIVVAGPAVNFALAAATYAVMGFVEPGALRQVLSFSAAANVLVGAANLIPAYPLDGGRMLRAGLAAWFGDHYKATHAAARLGVVLGLAAVLYGWGAAVATLNLWNLVTAFLGLFIVAGSRAAMFHPGTELVYFEVATKTPSQPGSGGSRR